MLHGAGVLLTGNDIGIWFCSQSKRSLSRIYSRGVDVIHMAEPLDVAWILDWGDQRTEGGPDWL